MQRAQLVSWSLWGLTAWSFLLALVLALCGCATYSETQTHASADNFAQCDVQVRTERGLFCVQVTCARLDAVPAPMVRGTLCAVD